MAERAAKLALHFVNSRAHSPCRGPLREEAGGLGVARGAWAFQKPDIPFMRAGGKASGKSSRTRSVGWTPRPSVTSGQARTGASILRGNHFQPFA